MGSEDFVVIESKAQKQKGKEAQRSREQSGPSLLIDILISLNK
jgi:hypothetical protein